MRQPLRAELDGLPVTYVPFLAPPRPRSYGSWGRWAAPPLAVALRRLRRRPFDLVHAHYAAPAGDAVRRAGMRCRWWSRARRRPARRRRRWRGGARGERGAARRRARARLLGRHGAARARSARCDTRVVHLGADLPGARATGRAALVTVGHLVARKRHADVLRARGCSATPTPGCAGSSSATGRSGRPWSGWRASWESPTACAFTGAAAARRGGRAKRQRAVRAAEHRRGVRRRLRRGDGRRRPRDRLPRRGRARGDRRRGAGASASSAPASPRRSRASCSRCR